MKMAIEPISKDGDTQPAAAPVMLTTYELIEHIILELPPGGILLVVLVNRAFQSVATTSVTIKDRLYNAAQNHSNNYGYPIARDIRNCWVRITPWRNTGIITQVVIRRVEDLEVVVVLHEQTRCSPILIDTKQRTLRFHDMWRDGRTRRTGILEISFVDSRLDDAW